MRTAVALSALAGLAAALGAPQPQNFFGSGEWFKLNTLGSTPPSDLGVYGAVAAGDGVMYVAGGPNATSNGVWQFAWDSKVWTYLAPMPTGAVFATDMEAFGGLLVMVGGAANASSSGYSNTLSVLSTVSPQNNFTTLTNLVSAPAPRSSHAIFEIGGVLYLHGGVDSTQYYQEVWAFDLTQLTKPFTSWNGLTWTPVVSNTAFGVPAARGAHTATKYEDRVYIFGGISHTVGVTDCSAAPANCVFYNDIWSWMPPTTVTANGFGTWTQIFPQNAVGNPPGRYNHAAAFVESSRLVVFGGVGVGQALLNDVWMFVELGPQGGVWYNMSPVGTLPPGLFNPRAVSIGRHYIMYSGQVNGPSEVFVYEPAWIPNDHFDKTLQVTCEHPKFSADVGVVVFSLLLGAAGIALSFLIYRNVVAGGASHTSAADSDMAYKGL